MKRSRCFLIALCFIIQVPALMGQERDHTLELGLNTSYFTHNTTLPFTILSFQHHGVEVNMEGIRNKGRTTSLLFNSSLSWYYHDHFANAFSLDFAVGGHFKSKFGLFFNTDLGIGYQLMFTPVFMYELNDEGEYVRDKIVSRSSIIIPLNFKLGYIFQEMKYPLSVFVKYKWFIQAPYIEAVPMVPHGSLHFGLGIRFKSISKSRTSKWIEQ